MKEQVSTTLYISQRRLAAVAAVALIFAFTAFSNIVAAQANQLMLADILIALRSKKVTLPERNKILAEAVVVRGITFALTPEIEKELSDTGADRTLIDSIRQKSHMVKTSAVVSPPVEAKAKPELVAPPPDFGFYEKRADISLSKGEFDAAIPDYTKAIEMEPKLPEAYLGRGIAYSSKQSYDLAIADFDKVIELKPKSAAAYANRAAAFERKGDTNKALVDYDKALELEPINEFVKTAAARIKDAQAKALAAAKKPEPVVAPPPKVTESARAKPDFVDLGGLTKSTAVKMITPVYPQFAVKSHIGGRVVIDVMLDDEGNVTSAKAGSGHDLLKSVCEEAARKSKFKPAMFENQPIRGKGFIIYNFTPEP